MDDLANGGEHGVVLLIEQLAARFRVPIDAEDQLGEVVRSDGDAVDAEGGVVVEAVHDRRHFGHDPPQEPTLPAERTAVDELEACLELPAGADEGDHEVQVRCLLADASEHLQLDLEQIRLPHVPVAAAVADHRVPLLGLETVAAVEAAELVRPEVDRAVDDRPWREGPRDGAQRPGHRVDERLTPAARQHLPGMARLERFGEHELGPQEADAIHIERRRRLCSRCQREVHVQLRRDRRGRCRPALDLRRRARVRVPSVSRRRPCRGRRRP